MKQKDVSILFGLFQCLIVGCSPQKPHQENPISVKIDTVKAFSRKFERKIPARILPASEVHLAFKTGGLLNKVNVHVGEFVHAGDLIAQMDDRDYKLQLQAIENKYNEVKAEAERFIRLYEDSVATPADYDKARYGLAQIKAQYENALNQLGETRMYAPFDGYVKSKHLTPPAVIGAGTPVVTLFSSGMPEVEIHLPYDIYRNREHIRQYSATFGYLPEPIPLRIISISQHANANQLYSVRLSLPASVKELPSVGMSAMVHIVGEQPFTYDLSIPASALFQEGGDTYVWTVSEGKTKRRKVSVRSLHTDGNAIVSQGLKAGETVITAGVNKLGDNQPVRPLAFTDKNN